MSALHDTARAKLNLTLEVLGRRADGFHELRSLVAFAGLGDQIAFEPGAELELSVEGPFAHTLAGENLILKAARAIRDSVPHAKLGRFRLVKNLPVAAGIGGGSADAAAALRLIARANSGVLTDSALMQLAPALGSDVSVCLASRPALIGGRGELVEPVKDFPVCGVLLANPGVPLATEAVYAGLRSEPLAKSAQARAERIDFSGDFEALLDYMGPRSNDLEAAATRLVPAISEVLAALLAPPGVRVARLSGSGPTCFALFATEDEADQARAELSRQRPSWWIAASTLGG
jgi:4-diphosphocytidyl-2-C-methyl-D-erythritol kinase